MRDYGIVNLFTESTEDMILALAEQFKQLLKLSSKCEDHIFS